MPASQSEVEVIRTDMLSDDSTFKTHNTPIND